MSLVHQIALTMLPGIGCRKAHALLDHYGSAEAVFDLPAGELIEATGINHKAAGRFNPSKALEKAGKEVEFVQQHRIKTFFCLDKEYPRRLKACVDAPVMLYYRGNADLNALKVISVVGSRNATPYGKSLCTALLKDLSDHQVLIVSGLAYGIDGTAHKEALVNGLPTVGVLGHGLDRLYPARHRQLARKMLDEGGLLTEFPSNTNPDRENFPRRNRLIAGLADAVVVVEASRKGGALITAELANDYNRDVFAFPGRVHDEYSEGCHWLVRHHKAALVCSASNIEYLLEWKPENRNNEQNNRGISKLSRDEENIMKFLSKNESISIEKLHILTGLSQNTLVNCLLNLEIEGFLCKNPGNMYIKM